MVDLVKIRKKAKDRKDAPAEPAGQAAPQAREAAAPPAKTQAAAPAEPQVSVPAAAAEAPAPAPPAAEEVTPGPVSSKLDKFKREAGRRRETEAAAQAAASGQQLLELLTFNISGEQYAVDIEHIVEIVAPRAATRVPNADPSVVGIVSLRGTVVTLVDVRRKLRHVVSAAAGGPEARIVVVEYGGETLGFLVDRVLRVVKVDPSTIEPQPVVHVSEHDEAVRGVFRIANALTILLDLDKLLDSRSTTAVVA